MDTLVDTKTVLNFVDRDAVTLLFDNSSVDSIYGTCTGSMICSVSKYKVRATRPAGSMINEHRITLVLHFIFVLSIC